MKNRLYNRIISSIGNDIRNAIDEQFNVGNMNLNNNAKRKSNIFNKAVVDPFDVYKRMTTIGDAAENIHIDEYEIQQLNDYTGVVKVKSSLDLRNIISWYAYEFHNDSLNWVDVSEITDMSYLVSSAIDIDPTHDNFNGDISQWDVSNVTNMSHMFQSTKFNGDISGWDVSNVIYMNCMFWGSYFNGDISKWNVSSVTTMIRMFENSEFNGNISEWDVSNVTDMVGMFQNSKFNQDISGWDVSNVKDMSEMFANSPFNNDLTSWNVNNVRKYEKIFYRCPMPEYYMPIKRIILM